MMDVMKAISLWEPWASLIRTGAKTIETRSWETKYRGLLLICAAKRKHVKELNQLLSLSDFQTGLLPLINSGQNVKIEYLNFGKAVAIVRLDHCIPTNNVSYTDFFREKNFGDFSFGRFAWFLHIIKTDFEPFTVKGSQGFFDVKLPLTLDNFNVE